MDIQPFDARCEMVEAVHRSLRWFPLEVAEPMIAGVLHPFGRHTIVLTCIRDNVGAGLASIRDLVVEAFYILF